MAVSFIGGGNQKLTTNLSQVTDKLYRIEMYHVQLIMSEIQTRKVVIGTDCIGSCKSNYHDCPFVYCDIRHLTDIVVMYIIHNHIW